MPPVYLSALEIVFSRFINTAISLVAIISVAMLVFGGIKFLTSGADKEGATQAQKTITFAVIGLILTISSWIILNLVGTFLGVNFGSFNVVYVSP